MFDTRSDLREAIQIFEEEIEVYSAKITRTKLKAVIAGLIPATMIVVFVFFPDVLRRFVEEITLYGWDTANRVLMYMELVVRFIMLFATGMVPLIIPLGSMYELNGKIKLLRNAIQLAQDKLEEMCDLR